MWVLKFIFMKINKLRFKKNCIWPTTRKINQQIDTNTKIMMRFLSIS